MCKRRCAVLCWITLAGGFVGCEAPILTVNHSLPPVLPVPVESLAVDAGDFSVTAVAGQDLGRFVAAEVRQCIRSSWRPGAGEVGGSEAEPEGRITAEIRIEQSETRGSRRVRTSRAAGSSHGRQEVPTLVRTVFVRARFAVVSATGGEQLVAAEISRPYSSADDPRARGPDGRADDPDRVPPAQDIVRQLLADCAASFCRMICPLDLEVRLQLRPVAGEQAETALAAAGAGDYPKASALFDEALRYDPNNPALMFNLAVLAEATGRLPAAGRFYQAVIDGSEGGDEVAEQGLIRVGRILNRRKRP